VNDPGTNTVSSYVIHWGDGASETFSGSPAGQSKAHTYADGFISRTITVDLTDEDGSFVGAGSQAVTVDNLAPTTNLSGAPNVNEGAPYTLSLGAVSDPGTETVSSYIIHWGDGASETFSGSPDGESKAHTYVDGSISRTITVDLTDEDGSFAAGSRAVTVNNVLPVITGVTGPANPLALSMAATVSAGFTDAGTLDTHRCTFLWDDASSTPGMVTEASGSGSCTAQHPYLAAGVCRVEVTVTDKDHGDATSAFEFVVVYDPSAGFVTGGGWIDSPAGAYSAIPALTGKATFGFVSKYLKGANTPTGQTEFDLHVANFNFHSTAYEWAGRGRCEGAIQGHRLDQRRSRLRVLADSHGWAGQRRRQCGQVPNEDLG
jgi:hypothetical protein